MHPVRSGSGFLPRYGGGWMQQFSHIYALQQEILSPTSHWFRAMELWHTAREEGIALNTSHYSNMLRQCVQPAAWEAAVAILHQMKRENIRPEVSGVSCALAACVEAQKPDQVEELFSSFSSTMLLDSLCYYAVIRSRMESGDILGAIKAGKLQLHAKIAFYSEALSLLLEACATANDAIFAEELLVPIQRDMISPPHRCLQALRSLAAVASPNTKIINFLEAHSGHPLLH